MNSITTPDPSDSPRTLAARVAAHFRERPGLWIDGRDLSRLAGIYGWRTRVSDVRKAPYFMRVENRQRRVRVDGHQFTISEYRFVNEAAVESA